MFQLDGSRGRIQFIGGQYELGELATRHFQGVVTFTNPTGLVGAKRLLGTETVHLEERKGSFSEAYAYCTKDDTREPGAECYYCGDPPADVRGGRTDLQGIKSILDAGGSLGDVADQYFGSYIRYYRGFTQYCDLKAPHRTGAPESYYFWGPAGTGKSHAAWSFGTEEETYSVPLSSGSNVWFDGYEPVRHRVIILDDYYHNFRFTFLLHLLDRYPMRVPYKGAHYKFNSKIVVVTSNIPLEEQYPNIPDVNSLRRRFKEVRHFTRLFVYHVDNPTITPVSGLINAEH